MNKYIRNLINEIDASEEICLRDIVNTFEKKIKKEICKYKCKFGLEDYKLNNLDYIILYYIWKNCNISIDVEDVLVIMYSFYKLEEFYFDDKVFEVKNPFHLLNNSNISFLIINILYIINGQF